MITYGAAYRLRELVNYRELVTNLTARDLKLKYRRSALGAAWSLLNPLMMMAIYTVVFHTFLRFPIRNYWAFVFTGLLVWTFFANALGTATTSLVSNSILIAKVYFPLEALTLSTVLSNLVNFLISLGLLIVLLLVFGLFPGVSILLLPILVLALFAFTLGIGLALGTLTVYFRDIEHLVGLGLTGLFFLTPVLYDRHFSSIAHNHYAWVLVINPMTWYVECFHAILYGDTWPEPRMLILVLVSAVLALLVGYGLFVRLRARLPEEV